MSFAYGSRIYQYDNDSNKLIRQGINPKNPLAKWDTCSGYIDYEWDGNGNLTKENHKMKDELIKNVTYIWDLENKLKEIRFTNKNKLNIKGNVKGSALEFVYDGDGRRVIKKVKYGAILQKEKIYI